MRTVRSLFAVATLVIAALAAAPAALGHFKPGTHNAIHAINLSWCGHVNRRCVAGDQAARVARCEASARYWNANRPQDAVNGQYRGMFQMGSSERLRFGHGPSVWHQARAAHAYYKLSWWYPWECADIIGLF
jgi:hypothetical protein